MKLSAVRKRRALTQVQVAHRLGVDQSVVSRIEKGNNMLLSTLFEYLAAAGAEHPRVLASIGGDEVELDLTVLSATGPRQPSRLPEVSALRQASQPVPPSSLRDASRSLPPGQPPLQPSRLRDVRHPARIHADRVPLEPRSA